MKQQKGPENENERGEEPTEPRKPNCEEEKEESVVELRRPGISPKPVPAPRHFFLRPTGKMANGTEPKAEESELSNFWARRSKSSSAFPIQPPEAVEVENE